jgi:hypothetical protein
MLLASVIGHQLTTLSHFMKFDAPRVEWQFV